MALPLLIAAAAMAAVQVATSLKQADEIRMNNRLNQMLADMNADFLEMDAWDAEKDGISQATRYRSMIDDIVGDQRVAFAQGGADVSYGSAKEVQEGAKLTGYLNQLDMVQQGRNQAQNLRNEALNVRFGASMAGEAAMAKARAVEYGGYAAAAQTGLKAWSGGAFDMKGSTGYQGKEIASAVEGGGDIYDYNPTPSPYYTASYESGQNYLNSRRS